MLYQFMPRLADDEYAALEQSIRDHGVRVPILVDDNRSIIDGHHRKEIADRLGVECPKQFAGDLTDEQKRTLALSLNVHRRHLSREQRRHLIESSLKADPHLSDRQHGDRTGSDHKTVGARRGELQQRGEIPHVSARTDAAGRTQPATKTPAPATGGEARTDAGQISEVPSPKAREESTPLEPFRPAESAEPALADLDDAGPNVQPETGSQPSAPSPRNLDDFIAGDSAVRDGRYLLALTKALAEVAGVHQYDPSRVAELADADTLRAIEAAHDNFTAWRRRVLDARSGGLRVIRGGRQ